MERTHYPSTDPRLDWAPVHDPRSRNYAVADVIAVAAPEPRNWSLGPVLDQGQEGACVGFGWTAELMASPRPDPHVTAAIGNIFARNLYRRAQRIDEWPGEDYEGTSVLAGAKVVTEMGYIESYRWAFSIEEMIAAVVNLGPVVIGIPWFESMYSIRPSGLVDVSGPLVGGHCILVHGYHPRMRIRGEGWFARHEVFRVRNSWGPSWGLGGSGYIRRDDMQALLADWGEACVPMGRRLVRL